MKRLLLAVIALLVLYSSGVVWGYVTTPEASVSIDEVIPNGETASSLRLVGLAMAAIAKEAEPDGLYKRDAHSKPHGCVHATFEVAKSDDLPLRFQFGAFGEPGKTYDAWLRFSNGTQVDDTKPDARGLGLKLMGVKGERLISPFPDDHGKQDTSGTEQERKDAKIKRAMDLNCLPDATQPYCTQDFNMINYPVFFLRDVMEYEKFFPYQVEGNPIPYFFAWNPLDWKVHELRNVVANIRTKVGSPLDATYYTMTAFKLGPHRNAKYSVAPCKETETAIPKGAGPDFLREALVREVTTRDACFEFRIQLQDATEYMPIEDPTIEWDEDESPYVAVAEIHIPKQDFNTDEQNQFCEQLSISPWNGVTDHKPVGGMNRVRRLAYEAVSKRRHARNGVERHEPRGACLSLDGDTCPQQSGAAAGGQ